MLDRDKCHLYSTKHLKAGYNGKHFSLLETYLNEKEPSAKVQFLNVF